MAMETRERSWGGSRRSHGTPAHAFFYDQLNQIPGQHHFDRQAEQTVPALLQRPLGTPQSTFVPGQRVAL